MLWRDGQLDLPNQILSLIHTITLHACTVLIHFQFFGWKNLSWSFIGSGWIVYKVWPDSSVNLTWKFDIDYSAIAESGPGGELEYFKILWREEEDWSDTGKTRDWQDVSLAVLTGHYYRKILSNYLQLSQSFIDKKNKIL